MLNGDLRSRSFASSLVHYLVECIYSLRYSHSLIRNVVKSGLKNGCQGISAYKREMKKHANVVHRVHQKVQIYKVYCEHFLS